MTSEEVHAEIGRLVVRIVGIAKVCVVVDQFPLYDARTGHHDAEGQTILEALRKLDAELGTGPE